MRDHLEAYERHTQRMHPINAEAPDLPESLLPLWEEFLKLHATRGVGLAGPAAISYRDIGCYQEVTRSTFTPWEVDVILQADREFFKALPEPKTKPEGR